jgi:2-dehydro-3-deoxy-L-rhamnonate dehydrogenase (NAD+)
MSLCLAPGQGPYGHPWPCRWLSGYKSGVAQGNTYDFEGRVALVTGGASGIGAATVERLRAGGARVVSFDLREGEADLALTGDVTKSADLDAAVERVANELGRLDVLVCSAGVSGDSLRTLDVADDEWNRVMGINATGVFYANRAAIRAMEPIGYGRIVNVASIAGKEGNPMAAAYSASKAAVIALTKAIGKDVAGTGILVNCVAPAVIDSPMLGDMTQEHVDYMIARVPLGRMGKPEEVASLIAYLASEELAFSTGACFDLSGGRAVY